MKRKISGFLAILLCAAALSACAPESAAATAATSVPEATPALVGEDEAKQAGLDLINLVFGANETDASVAYATQSGYSCVDGEIVHTGNEQPVYLCRVSTPAETGGGSRYTAEVNAETGVAYRATMSIDYLPEMTAVQRDAAKAAYGSGDWNEYDFETVDMDCTDAARDWISNTLHPNVPILGFINCGFISDNVVSPGAAENFYAVMRDGTIYYFDMAWPQLTILEFAVLNQIEPYGDEP